MARAVAKRRKRRKVNPAAKALGTPAYRPRIVKSKKLYRRKVRTAPGGPDPAER
jgi:hypothetical protein